VVRVVPRVLDDSREVSGGIRGGGVNPSQGGTARPRTDDSLGSSGANPVERLQTSQCVGGGLSSPNRSSPRMAFCRGLLCPPPSPQVRENMMSTARERRRERRGNSPRAHRPVIRTIRGQRRVVGCICGTWPCTEYQQQARERVERREAKGPKGRKPEWVDYQQSRREYEANKRRLNPTVE
jgi:hypothetical protein